MATDASKGETITEQGETQDAQPHMPHEHDESAHSQQRDEPSARRIGRRAHADATRGTPDTSKAPELEATYDRLREGGAAPPDEETPRE